MLFIGSSRVYLLLLFLPLIFITPTNGHSTTCYIKYTHDISLNQTMTRANQRMYDIVVPINATSGYELQLVDPAKSLSFIIFEVHSQLHNVTLFRNIWSPETAVEGRNLGLYSSVVNQTLDAFSICNMNNVEVMVYINVLGYRELDPIPGGCNMEFPTPIAPYIQTTMNKDYITVDLAAPGIVDHPNCRNDNVHVHFYLMYFLEKYTTDIIPYFTNIGKMFEVEWIITFGELLPESGDNLRRRVATYHGMGVVFAAVASRNSTFFSVYVPNGMFSCNPLEEGDCDRAHGFLDIITCISLYVWGFFICYFGHYFFKTSTFLMGALSGGILTYIVISLWGVVDQTALIGVSVLSGVGFGAIWLLWWFYGLPLISISLPALNVGFLLASTLFHYSQVRLDRTCCEDTIIEKMMVMRHYSLLIDLVILSVTLILCTCILLRYTTNILCCAILGAYSIVFATGYHVSHNLNYIFINLVRYAVVPDFKKVYLALPPRQREDTLVEVLFALLVFSGVMTQLYMDYGRDPLPPPPRSVRPAVSRHYGAIDQDNCSDDDKQQTTSITPSTENDEATPLLA